MHIVVYGVGAIGGFYGSKLLRALNFGKYADFELGEVKISFVARGANYKALKDQGLTLVTVDSSGKEESLTQTITVYDNFADVPHPDCVLLCVKSKDTEAAAKDIAESLSDSGYVVSIQNGVDNEKILSRYLGEPRVVGCLTNIAAQNRSPGVVSQAGKHYLILGEMDHSLSKRVHNLFELFTEAGVKVKISENITVAQWEKLVWNAGFNPISALYELTVGELFANKDHAKTIHEIMEEAKDVALAQKIPVRDDIVDYQYERSNVPEWADFKTSMLQDILRKRPIELDELLGIVIERGKELGVSTPKSVSIYEALKSKIAK